MPTVLEYLDLHHRWHRGKKALGGELKDLADAFGQRQWKKRQPCRCREVGFYPVEKNSNEHTSWLSRAINFAAPAPAPCLRRPLDIEAAKAKLRKCDRKHSCHSAGGKLPTRLIDLGISGDDDRIKLVVTAEQEITDCRYAALSYCWGTVQPYSKWGAQGQKMAEMSSLWPGVFEAPFTTQPGTLHQRLAGFAITDMPATLRDAAKVARDLGIRYLWVDALCILQGSPDDLGAQLDWKRESGRMDQVYGNAYVTIVAAASSDCGSGLIPLSPSGKALDLSSQAKEKYCGTGIIDFGSEPLFARGWAQQEWLLSARLLAFTSVGMHLFCDVWTTKSTHASHSFRLPKSPRQLEDTDWFKVVMDFCGRNLTQPRDKLPAISGLARRFYEMTDGALGDYLAGLWRARLPEDLMWKRGAEAAMHFPQSPRGGRIIVDNRPRAPSWSWAAVDGPIRLAIHPRMIATVLDCSTEPSPGHDQFGEILSGTLLLCCPYITAHVAHETPQGPYLLNDAGKTCPFWPDDDAEAEQLAQSQVAGESLLYCLGMSSGERSSQYMGLVVKAERETGYFTRVGFFWASRTDFADFDAAAKRTFNIV